MSSLYSEEPDTDVDARNPHNLDGQPMTGQERYRRPLPNCDCTGAFKQKAVTRIVRDDHAAAKPVAVQKGNDVNPPPNA
jgi:hypothetical protein